MHTDEREKSAEISRYTQSHKLPFRMTIQSTEAHLAEARQSSK